MIDRVVDLVLGELATGIKNVSVNEPFFAGHFPNHPVMPGVLIIEEHGANLRRSGRDDAWPGRGGQGRLLHVDRWREVPPPGDARRSTARGGYQKQRRGPVWKFQGVAKVDGAVVAEAVYSAMIMDRAEPI